MRIQYRHPKLYDFLMRFLYPRQLTEKFSREKDRFFSIRGKAFSTTYRKVGGHHFATLVRKPADA